MIIKCDYSKRIKKCKDLVIGEKYYVTKNIWSGFMIYCGHIFSPKKIAFTFGNSTKDYLHEFNLCGYFKDFNIYKITDCEVIK